MCVLEVYKVRVLTNQEWVLGSWMIGLNTLCSDLKQFLQGIVLSPLSHDMYLSFYQVSIDSEN